MSQIASNSVPDKPTLILIFTLVILNVSHLTTGIPTDIPVAYENVKQFVQPEASSSYWGLDLGEMVSYGVKSIQNVIKFVIGVNDPPPREFCLVRIRDKKNPGKYRDVWRERGQEGKDNDIPLDGGKLPENSMVVNAENPVTEFASSPESTSPSTTAPPEIDVPIAEKRPENKNGNSIKNTDGENKGNVLSKNPEGEKNAAVNPSSPSVETQVPAEGLIKDDESVPIVTSENNPSAEQDPKHVKSEKIPQLGQTNNDLNIDQDPSEKGSSQNSDPASSEQKNAEIKNLLKELPKVEELLTPLLEKIDHHPSGTTESNPPKIAEPSEVQDSKHVEDDEFLDEHDGEEGNSQNSKHPPKPEEMPPSSADGKDSIIPAASESPSFDPNQLISMNECEVEFEKTYCKENLKSCEQFQSDEEFIAFVKENSGCSSEEPQTTHPPADNSDESATESPSSNPNDVVSMNECEKEFKENFCLAQPEFCDDPHSKELADYIKTYSGCAVEEQQIIHPPADHPDHSAESSSNNPSDDLIISMNECEKNFKEAFCRENPEFCENSHSKELAELVKTYSGCSPEKEITHPPTDDSDHSPESPPSTSNDLISMNECEMEFKEKFCEAHSDFCEDPQSKDLIDYIKTYSGCSPEKEITHPPTDDSDHSPESPPSTSNDLISMNECEKEFKEKFCEAHSDFCEDPQSKDLIDYIKTYSGCPSEEQQIPDAIADHPDHSAESPLYNPNDLISMNECETDFEKRLCGEHPKFCKEFKSKEDFIEYVKIYSGCSPEAEGHENGRNEDIDRGAGDDHISNGEDNPHDLESSGNFDDLEAINDHRNDESLDSHPQPAQTITKKKSGVKKKSKSLKTKKRSTGTS